VSHLIFVLGAGGHAKVILDAIFSTSSMNISGIVDCNPMLVGGSIFGVPIIGSNEIIFEKYLPKDVLLINGIGSISPKSHRQELFNKFKKSGFNFANIVHVTGYVGKEVLLGEGAQILAGGIVQPGCHIGNNVIVNTNASIDHDCFIGDHVHLAPRVVCCGNVTIGRGSHIGAGAVVLQGVTIGENCLIASGAVVTRDVPSHCKVAGVPAKNME